MQGSSQMNRMLSVVFILAIITIGCFCIDDEIFPNDDDLLNDYVDEPPIVDCPAGLIQGKYIALPNGKRVVAYLGIPFAQPPVGSMRFKPPVALPRWSGIFNATMSGPLCVQSKARFHWDIVTTTENKLMLKRLGLWDYPQGEDCLNMNIYVPVKGGKATKNENHKAFSIMFYIHGGSYKTNGARFYHGQWLSSAGEVIVITVNYRLGVLGFLSTQDSAAEGNYGLLDQVLALQWIKKNIPALGGNPDDITIFGNSAGGACVCLHLVSPISKGLFSKVIAQSGSPLGEWAMQRRPRYYVQQLATKLGCPDIQDNHAMVDCLRNTSTVDILKKSEDAKTLEDSLMLPFAPVVDKKFLPRHPNELLRERGAVADVPVIVGITRNELEVWMTKSYQDKDPSSIPFTKDLLRRYLLHLVRRESMPERTIDVLLHAVYTEYVYHNSAPSHHNQKLLQLLHNASAIFQGNSISVQPDIGTLGKIISDIDLKAPSVKLVDLLATRPNVSVYMYVFDYASSDDVIISKFGGVNNTWVGSYHESELYYIFGFPHLNLDNALRLPEDKDVSSLMIQLWTDFAKYGSPTPEHQKLRKSKFSNFTWTPYTEEGESYASLNIHPYVGRSYEKERMTFWNHFVPLLIDYPIAWSSSKKSSRSTVAKLLEECQFEMIAALTFLGWATCILCVGFVIHICLCRRFSRALKMRNIAIPV